jgi:uncharacterized protein (DUF1330 family)
MEHRVSRGRKTMAAYLIAQIEVINSELYEEYRRLVPALIASHGGRYLVRSGTLEVLEGNASSNRLAIVEFPHMTALRAFYESDAYQPLMAIRRRAARSMLLAVTGL